VFAANLARLTELERLRAQCAAVGVQLLYLKGAAFLDTLYDLGERPMADVDVLVRPWQRPVVDRLLLEAGYERPASRERPVTREEHYEWCYRRAGPSPINLEIHARFYYPRAFDIDYDGVWSRAVERVTPHRPVPTLSTEDTLLHVSLHEAVHSFILDLRSSEDIRRIVERWGPDWEIVIQRAREWGMCTILFASLTAAARRGAEVPARVLAALRPPPVRLSLLRLLVDLDGSGRARAARRSRWQQLLSKLILVERPRNLASSLAAYAWLRARDAAGQLFRASA
jgi:hypothetical protein